MWLNCCNPNEMLLLVFKIFFKIILKWKKLFFFLRCINIDFRDYCIMRSWSLQSDTCTVDKNVFWINFLIGFQAKIYLHTILWHILNALTWEVNRIIFWFVFHKMYKFLFAGKKIRFVYSTNFNFLFDPLA